MSGLLLPRRQRPATAAAGLTFVGAGTVASGSSVSGITVDFPGSIAEDDLMVLCCGVENDLVFTVPAGWTEELQFATSAQADRALLVCWKLYEAADGSSVDANLVSFSGDLSGFVLGFRGVDQTTPVDSSDEILGNYNTLTPPSNPGTMTATSGDMAVFLGVTTHQGIGALTSVTAPDGATLAASDIANGNTNLYGAYESLTGNPDTGVWTLTTLSGLPDSINMTMVLNPA